MLELFTDAEKRETTRDGATDGAFDGFGLDDGMDVLGAAEGFDEDDGLLDGARVDLNVGGEVGTTVGKVS